MGRSVTIHVIGCEKKSDGSEELHYAMNKTEISQIREKLSRKNRHIFSWYAQTKTGCKMIGADSTLTHVADEDVSGGRIVRCFACGGRGYRHVNETKHNFPNVRGCPVCDGSGVCSPGHWKKWNDWQIATIRSEFGLMV